MRPLLLASLLLAACGDETTVINNYGTGGGDDVGVTSAGGEGGESADGGDGPGVTATVAAGSTASASSSSGSDGGGGAGGATSSASSGAGGQGGEAPACADATCPEFGLVCDSEACGEQWPSCDGGVCTTDPEWVSQRIYDDPLELRLPPVAEQHAQCAENCPEVVWAYRFPIIGPSCLDVRTPPGATFDIRNNDDGGPDGACPAELRSCARVEVPPASWLVVAIVDPVAFGQLVHIEPVEDCEPLEVECEDLGCNGDGG